MPPKQPTRTAPQPAHEAKQARSRRTLEAILEAAEQLLAERDFHQITMADLAKRAGCGVGTLYGRIPNKESLLACLYQRHGNLAEKMLGGLFAACEGAGLESRAQVLCRFAVDYCEANRGSIRATTAHLFAHADDVYGFRKSMTADFEQFAGLLAECREEIAHPDPLAASQFALLAVSDVAQSRVVFGDRVAVQLHYSKKTLVEQLTHLVLCYLRTPPTA